MNKRFKVGATVFVSFLFCTVLLAGVLLTGDPLQTTLDTLDSNILEVMNDCHIPGVAACAVKAGNVVWMRTYGYADIEHNVSVTNDTLFMLGSVSKIVTGIAFMQLYEDGLIGLDDDINDFLSFDIVHPAYPDSIITPRMLLSHVSGIHDNWNILYPMQVSGTDSPITLDMFTKGYLMSNGTYYEASNFNSAEPGTLYDYTNAGSTLVAYLVEVISGISFEQYCQDNIWIPLGMNETSWFLSELDTDSIAVPYDITGSTNVPIGHYSSAVYPCGFMRTSIKQQALLMTMLMEGGAIGDTRILDNDTLQEMMTLHYPELVATYGFFFENYEVLWGHNGVGPGVATRTFFYPEVHEGIIIMQNLEDTNALNTIHNHILAGMRSAYGWLT